MCPDDAVVEVEGSGELVDGGTEDGALVDVVVVVDVAGAGAGDVALSVLATAALASLGAVQGLSDLDVEEAREEDGEGDGRGSGGERTPRGRRPVPKQQVL